MATVPEADPENAAERAQLERRARAQLELLRRDGKHHLYSFIQRWQPKYRKPTHMDRLVRALDASLTKRQELKPHLILCEAPPRHFKTSIVIAHSARCVSDWGMGVAYCTYAGDIAKERSREARDLVLRTGAWVGEAQETAQAFEPAKSVTFWSTDNGGRFVAGGRQGQFIGRGFDFIAYDDGIKNEEESLSPVTLNEAYRTYTMLASRLEPGGTLLVTHQRWPTKGDPIGRIKQLIADDQRFADVEVITLRALEDIRTGEDELGREIITGGTPLCPWRYTLESFQTILAMQGALFWANYQQDDTARGDRVFPEFERYDEPTTYGAFLCISCDPGLRKRDVSGQQSEKKRKPDPAGIVVGWCYVGRNSAGKPMVGIDLVDARNLWLRGTELLDLLERLQKEDYAGAPVVLETVSAFVLYEELGQRLNPELQIQTWTPVGSKYLRAQPVGKAARQLLVRVPRQQFPWVAPFCNQAREFTGAEGGDDAMIDALTQMYDYACLLFGLKDAGGASGGEPSIITRDSPW